MFNILTTAIKGAIISFTVFLIAILALMWVPQLWGWQSFRVTSSSMAPYIRPNNIIVVQPVESSELRTGDIITYQQPGFNTETHRIVEIADGMFYTQGDAVPDATPAAIEYQWIIGRVVFQVPLGGFW
ncbi:MAG: signal peptidase I [Firmicutes bacterium]|nr:signal peptidase I [Bacillota bacterium]